VCVLLLGVRVKGSVREMSRQGEGKKEHGLGFGLLAIGVVLLAVGGLFWEDAWCVMVIVPGVLSVIAGVAFVRENKGQAARELGEGWDPRVELTRCGWEVIGQWNAQTSDVRNVPKWVINAIDGMEGDRGDTVWRAMFEERGHHILEGRDFRYMVWPVEWAYGLNVFVGRMAKHGKK